MSESLPNEAATAQTAKAATLITKMGENPSLVHFLKSVQHNVLAETLVEDYGFTPETLVLATGFDRSLAEALLTTEFPDDPSEFVALTAGQSLILANALKVSFAWVRNMLTNAELSMILNNEGYFRKLTDGCTEASA